MPVARRIYSMKRNQIFSRYISIKYGLCNSTNLYYSDFIKNLYIVSKSIHSHISLYINKNKKYLRSQIYCFYWIVKEMHKLLVYDLYWNLELSKNTYNYLVYCCKHLLYSKDSLKRLRINNHIKLKQFIQQLFNLLKLFFESYNILLSFVIVKKLYKLFSDILYFWYKKKYKKVLRFELRKLHNYWNSKLFIAFIIKMRLNLLYMTFLQQINR
uniref:Reverse transcriptase N-terminal domain-containing protein n=1 Tax=Gracilaria caudata TaxID=2572395 RepID=A0A345U6K4_9FLOR|nr:hypothetical protein [Gracilaria caudata]AXI96090.1 hypothetical protein [Gracilaria caudata]